MYRQQTRRQEDVQTDQQAPNTHNQKRILSLEYQLVTTLLESGEVSNQLTVKVFKYPLWDKPATLDQFVFIEKAGNDMFLNHTWAKHPFPDICFPLTLDS